jgi:hypothetical protein
MPTTSIAASPKFVSHDIAVEWTLDSGVARRSMGSAVRSAARCAVEVEIARRDRIMPRTLYCACVRLLGGVAGVYLARLDRAVAAAFGAGVSR